MYYRVPPTGFGQLCPPPLYSLQLLARQLCVACFLITVFVVHDCLISRKSLCAQDELGQRVKAAVAQIDPCVVRIQLIAGSNAADEGTVASSVTTGVCVAESGQIVTSAFAFDEVPQAILVADAKGRRQAAKLVAIDHVRKLALLQTEGTGWTAMSRDQMELKPRIGQWAVGLGRYYDASTSNLSVGVVSAVNRIHGMALQTDAKISPFNYGGPLISLSGRVLGILVPLSPQASEGTAAGVEWYDSGIGFAIPIADVLTSCGSLQAGAARHRGRLGLSLVETNPFSSTVTVAEVVEGGPAQTAGLKTGDRILSVNGRDIERPPQLMAIIAASYAGDSIQVTIRREDETQDLKVTLVEKMPQPVPGFLGFIPALSKPKPESLTGELQRQLRQQPGFLPLGEKSPDDDAGVAAVVVEGGPAAAAGLSGTIQLRRVNGQPVNSPSSLRQQLARLRPGQTASLVISEGLREDAKRTVSVTVSHSAFQVYRERSDSDSESELSAVPARAPAISEQLLADLHAVQEVPPGDVGAQPAVERHEITLGQESRIVLLQPEGAKDRTTVLVVIIPTAETNEAAILSSWKPLMHAYGISLAIPVSGEQRSLTDEDAGLVIAGIHRAVLLKNIDPVHVYAVNGHPSTQSLARALLTHRRSGVRGMAMVDGRVAGMSNSDLAMLHRFVLQLAVPQDRALSALTMNSLQQLSEAGVTVSVPKEGLLKPAAVSADEAAQIVAEWIVGCRAI
ncbi:MAG: PDZ domain-containing protein [Planctomycetaceae bacterium]|nr:PDZ domain-containing protein [Planctomycetaceae bacterium]